MFIEMFLPHYGCEDDVSVDPFYLKTAYCTLCSEMASTQCEYGNVSQGFVSGRNDCHILHIQTVSHQYG